MYQFLLIFILYSNHIVVYTASKINDKNWDPKCSEKWPSCTRDGKLLLNTACETTSCDPKFPECLEVPCDTEFRQMVLDTHNELRNKVASGEEKRSNLVSAGNMMALSYDLGLEFTSICHAHGCIMEHDKCRGTKKFPIGGQNLAQRTGKSNMPLTQQQFDGFTNLKAFKSLVNGWYDTEIEKDDFKELIDNFTRFNHDTGHFTALIWAATTHLGCARAIYRPNKSQYRMHITCNYGPPGNVNNRPMYVKGAPCSKCPSGTSCNKKFTSLCGEIDDIHTGSNMYRDAEKAPANNVKNLHEKSRKNELFNFLILITNALLM